MMSQQEESVPFANLHVRHSEIGVSADADGRFILNGLYPGDSLTASAIGFRDKVMVIGRASNQVINFRLQKANLVLESVMVKPSDSDEENGQPLIRRIIDAKPKHDYRSISTYSCEVYNKLELDLAGEKLLEKPILRSFSFLDEFADSTKQGKVLPALLSESLSDYLYRAKPTGSKEFIKASRISGISEDKFAPFLGQMHQEFSIYDNWMALLGQNFVSPIADGAPQYYKFYLADSLLLDGRPTYLLQFTPRRGYENMFYGTMQVCATSLAVLELNMQLAEGGQINFVDQVAIRQQYVFQDGRWLRDREQLVVRFKGLGKNSRVIGRKTTSYRDYELETAMQEAFFEDGKRLTIYEDALVKDDKFWRNARHEELNEREEIAYTLSDRLQEDPAFQTWVDVVQFLFTGYQQIGPVEFGPYFKMIGRNDVEGLRLRLGMRTSGDFSEKLKLGGYAAYGFKDEKWKFGAGLTWIPDRENWQEIGLWIQDDILTGSLEDDEMSEGNLLTGLYRRVGSPPQKLLGKRSGEFWYRRDWTNGFSSHFEFRREELTPFFPSYYYSDRTDPASADSVVIRNEFSIQSRFAKGEKFLLHNFSRSSLGSDGPAFNFRYAYGIPGPSRRSISYHRLELGIQDRFPINPIGEFEYDLRVGKLFGELPLLLLEVHKGNETWFYSDNAFSLMNQYEFASDAWATLFVTHHFDGFFFNRIPLLKKLKWRSLLTAKAAYGGLSYENERINRLNDGSKPWFIEAREASPLPYVEAGLGIENIFRLIRIDALWRLTYIDKQSRTAKVQPFGVRAGLEFQF